MKQYILIARKNIIDPSTGGRLCDKGLEALDGIWQIPITVPSNSESLHSIMDVAIAEFEQTHPDLHGLKYEMVEVPLA